MTSLQLVLSLFSLLLILAGANLPIESLNVRLGFFFSSVLSPKSTVKAMGLGDEHEGWSSSILLDLGQRPNMAKLEGDTSTTVLMSNWPWVGPK